MTRKELTCKPIRESERKRIIAGMSPESIIISEGVKWSEKGFTPSFEDTDRVLMKAARRTHKALAKDNQ
jgi:hypothetical protein